SMVYDILARRFRPLYAISVAVAVLGALVIRYGSVGGDFWLGFLLVQGANLCFGTGQSAYKFLLEYKDLGEQKGLFGYFFVGACAVTGVAFWLFGDFHKISLDLTQGLTLLWLGVGAGGLGYFLWNKGACEVDSGALAIMNNALIPAAIVVNLVFWYKPTDITRLVIGGAIIYVSLAAHKHIVKFYDNKATVA
ncbi:MAG: hypothetical protein LUC34_03465, partial [Campylobacter sp.]|nr:hypothetical protein [Campylobacter sp.]